MEALKAGRRKFFRIVVKEGPIKSPQIKEVLEEALRRHVPLVEGSMEEIAQTVGAEGHQGIVALVTSLPYTRFDTLEERLEKLDDPFVVLLDGVTDPRNFGAVIRSAEAMGAEAVIFPAHRAASYTPTAAKTSAGAGERMTLVQVPNIAEAVRKLREESGFYAVAFEGDAGESVTRLPSGKLAIVMGDEGTGVRPLTRKRCDALVSIPMKGTVGSLNIASAASIACFLASTRSKG
ncbi:MAG: 23S rRNA (guanosine(2251)-2'-O)-methyltransferase RlmB [Nitrospinae bacterium]|nr:23S rRNA (guanosine(2251)-2'-O)-methyltransferase RlmB [Nitrospinota bacterium]